MGPVSREDMHREDPENDGGDSDDESEARAFAVLFSIRPVCRGGGHGVTSCGHVIEDCSPTGIYPPWVPVRPDI